MQMEQFVGSKEKFALAPKYLWEITGIIKEQSKLNPAEFLSQYEVGIRSTFPGSLANAKEDGVVPVMICARNEKENIGRTLHGLSRLEIPVQPLVVDNASNDGTGEFARRLGAEVVREEKPGLLNALRRGFNYLKEMNYSGPLLLTDADTVPLPTWASAMIGHARSVIPSGGEAFGRIFHYDYDGKPHILKNAILSMGTNILDNHAVKRDKPWAHGPNGIIMTDKKGHILDRLSRLIEFLPDSYGTDVAVLDAVKAAGGRISFCKDLNAMVVTSGRRYPGIQDVFGLAIDRKGTKNKVYKEWIEANS